MINWLAYQILMWLPLRCSDPDFGFGQWVLPRAGAWAYRDQQCSEAK